MKRSLQFLLPALAVGLVALVSSPKAQGASSASDEKTLIQMEHDWGNALIKRDMAVIGGMEASDYTFTSPDGSVSSKADSDAEIKSGAAAIESFKIDDLKVQIFGDTAVVHGLETEKSTYKGKNTSGQYRFTDVFVKRDGTWKAIATHASRVEKH
ncbi:MAG: hypothetical protein JWM88_3182 [Verrucomicrobia bacterium]|nr:hypothetical protein [Verrucomicrobiota bacterium]